RAMSRRRHREACAHRCCTAVRHHVAGARQWLGRYSRSGSGGAKAGLGQGGTAYYRNGDYTHALADYGAAIDVSPQCGACYNNRGMARNQTGDYDGAIADFTAALQYEQHDPDLWQVYLNRGIASYHKNDNDQAIADYDQAIKLNPRRSE